MTLTPLPTPHATAPRSSGRLTWLDGLRGVAATTVFVAHFMAFNSPGFQAASHRFFHWGVFGVLLFLCISGFVIPMSLERSANLKGFWVSRFWRLYPLFWAVLVPYALYLSLSHAPRATGFPDFLVNLTMMPYLFQRPIIVGPSWTLSIEMVFYAIASVLFAARLGRASVLFAYLAVAATLVGLCILPMSSYEIVFAYTIPFIGTALYRWHEGQAGRTAWIPVGLYASILLVLVFTSPPEYGHYWARGKAVSGLLALALFAGVLVRPRLLNGSRLLAWLGKVSYSTYLWHVMIIAVGMKLFAHVSLPPLPWLVLQGLFSYALTLVVSTASYRWIEEPAIAIGHRMRRRAAPSSS